MHAYIVTGGTSDERSGRITDLVGERSVSAHDTITIIPEGPSIGVDSVRELTGRLSIHPISSPCHAVVVPDAHAMTPEAQNAFLKTLEEPPGGSLIILETSQPDSLLPTILSRCQLVNLGNTISYTKDELLGCLDAIRKLEEASIGKRLQIIDTMAKTRNDVLAYTNLAIAALHHELMHQDGNSKMRTNEAAKLLRRFLTARTQLLGNVNPKLALDAVFLYNGFRA